jgi:hypothetical protein
VGVGLSLTGSEALWLRRTLIFGNLRNVGATKALIMQYEGLDTSEFFRAKGDEVIIMFNSISQFFRKFGATMTIDGTASMEPLGRDEYKYVEGDHALKLQVEMLSGTPRRVIYSRTIKNWLPPNENERITEQKRKEILERVCKYFDVNGISYTVE